MPIVILINAWIFFFFVLLWGLISASIHGICDICIDLWIIVAAKGLTVLFEEC